MVSVIRYLINSELTLIFFNYYGHSKEIIIFIKKIEANKFRLLKGVKNGINELGYAH